VETVLFSCGGGGVMTFVEFLLTKTASDVSVFPCALPCKGWYKIGKGVEFCWVSLEQIVVVVMGGHKYVVELRGGPGPVDQNGVSVAGVENGAA